MDFDNGEGTSSPSYSQLQKNILTMISKYALSFSKGNS